MVEYWNGEEHDHEQILPLQVAPSKDAQVQDAIKEGVLDGLKPEQIIMKLEWFGLPILSHKSLCNKIAYFRRTLTQYSSKFSTKDLRGWAETLSGSTSKDEALIIGSIIDDNAGEDGILNFPSDSVHKVVCEIIGQVRSVAIACRWHIQACLPGVSRVHILDNICSTPVPPSELVASEP